MIFPLICMALHLVHMSIQSNIKQVCLTNYQMLNIFIILNLFSLSTSRIQYWILEYTKLVDILTIEYTRPLNTLNYWVYWTSVCLSTETLFWWTVFNWFCKWYIRSLSTFQKIYSIINLVNLPSAPLNTYIRMDLLSLLIWYSSLVHRWVEILNNWMYCLMKSVDSGWNLTSGCKYWAGFGNTFKSTNSLPNTVDYNCI